MSMPDMDCLRCGAWLGPGGVWGSWELSLQYYILSSQVSGLFKVYQTESRFSSRKGARPSRTEVELGFCP